MENLFCLGTGDLGAAAGRLLHDICPGIHLGGISGDCAAFFCHIVYIHADIFRIVIDG